MYAQCNIPLFPDPHFTCRYNGCTWGGGGEQARGDLTPLVMCNADARRYGPPNQPFGPEWSVPCCIVESTLGDRRLGTHVLSGILLLLPELLDSKALAVEELASYFPLARRELTAGDDFVVPTADFMTDHMMAVEMVVQGILPSRCQGLSFDVPRNTSTLGTAISLDFPHRQLTPGSYPRQYSNAGPHEMAVEWRPLWDRTCEELNTLLSRPGGKKVLGYLFSRLGADCGLIMRTMHDARISWGTYQDELCIDDSQWHCNAHSNNLVVLAEGCSDTMFLGFLDLDMSFDDETFVSVYGRASPVGTVGSDQAAHDVLLQREHLNFMEVLAGGDTTSGVPMVAKAEVDEHCIELRLASSLLHDTLILGYLEHYTADSVAIASTATIDKDLHAAAAAIIKLAIIVMADFVA